MGFPLFEIRVLPLTLEPEALITGDKPKNAENCREFSKVLKPLVHTMSKMAVLRPSPGIESKFESNSCPCVFMMVSNCDSSSLISASNWRMCRFTMLLPCPLIPDLQSCAVCFSEPSFVCDKG